MPAHKPAVNVSEIPHSPSADVPEHITFLKTLTRTYSPTGKGNIVFWIMVFAFVEAWKCPSSRFTNDYRSLLDGINADLPPYYALLDMHLVNNSQLISELKIEHDSTVILRLTDVYALEVSPESMLKPATGQPFTSTDGAMWEMVSQQLNKPTHYMIYIGEIEGFIGSEPGGPTTVNRDILDQDEKEMACMPVGGNGHHRAMIIRMEEGKQDCVFPEKWCRLHNSDMPASCPNLRWFTERNLAQKHLFDLRLSF